MSVTTLCIIVASHVAAVRDDGPLVIVLGVLSLPRAPPHPPSHTAPLLFSSTAVFVKSRARKGSSNNNAAVQVKPPVGDIQMQTVEDDEPKA